MNRSFEAPDLIEVMDEAVNYNRYLIELLATWCGAGAKDILDFGAGNGRFASALHERGFNVAAVEPDADLRKIIQAEGVDAYRDLNAVDDGSVDAIYSMNVLEHIEDDEAILASFHRKLRSGGRLLSYVPAFQVLFSENDRRVGHVRRYRKSELVERTRRAGFRIESAEYVDSLGFLAGLAYRFFGNRDGGLNIGVVKLYDSAVFPVSRVVDRLTRNLLGKNLLVRAVRSDG